MSELALYLLAPILIGAGGGFAAGAYGRSWRRRLQLIWLALPLAGYTLWLASSPPASQGGFWLWWGIGLFYLALPLIGWGFGACVAYSIASKQR